MIDSSIFRVYLVTDNPSAYAGNFVDSVEEAIDGGVTIVQYRDTQSDDRTAFDRITQLQKMLKSKKIPLIINNRADIALAVNADGIHIGQSDMPPEAVRRIVGNKMILGLSVTNENEVHTVENGIVDYVGIGPVFDAVKTKNDAAPPLGLERFKKIRDALSDFPAVAIGGINLENAKSIVEHGANGLAIVSAFSKSGTPKIIARAFTAVWI